VLRINKEAEAEIMNIKTEIDGIKFTLKEPYNFSFLKKYGTVFAVFDEQGSGNICFGVQNGSHRYFIKFAGAQLQNYNGSAEDIEFAIARLKASVQVYKDLSHPNLIRFISSEEAGDGYATIFDWENALGIEPVNSPDYLKFMNMPTEHKQRAFNDILSFHAHVAAKGYVAIDFYDGNFLYDYENTKAIVCDIDFYQKAPYIGNMGLWGHDAFISPEEQSTTAVMDEITTVYTMGATAFSLFAHRNRTLEKWTLTPALYEVAQKAVSNERSERQQSVVQFMNEWNKAL